jgi:hypothetical protein
MTLGDLVVLYGVAGVVSAGAVLRGAPPPRKAAALSALLCVPLWPLWLPVVLSAGHSQRERKSSSDPTWAAIWEAHEAVLGTALEPLLPREAALRMLQEVERASVRHAELVALLAQPQYCPDLAQQRVASLEREGGSVRSLAPARLHLENVRRLAALKSRDQQMLAELAELATALRTQLVLARYAGSSPTDAGDIVTEVWARVEVLGTALEAPLTPSAPDHAVFEARSVGG